MNQQIDRELSQKVAQAIKARMGQCYHNAYMALFELPKGAQYVEGYIVTYPKEYIVEHGWVELDGKIIDPTLFNKPNIIYFPGLRFEGPLAVTAAMGAELPVSDPDDEGGPITQGIMEAYADAWDYLIALKPENRSGMRMEVEELRSQVAELRKGNKITPPWQRRSDQ